MCKTPCVYILASGRNEELFEGVRVHRQGLIDGFTKKYGVQHLLCYEMHET